MAPMKAMKAMKRRASSPAGSSSKKRKVSLKGKCAQVSSAVSSVKTLPPAVRSMIASKVEDAFGTYKEDRHPFQTRIIAMVSECLNTIQSDLQTAITDAEGKKASLEAEISSFVSENDAAAVAAEAASKTVEERKAALADSKTAVKNAKVTLQQAEADVKNGAAELATTSNKKEQLETFLSNTVAPAKEGTIEPAQVKKGVADAKQIGKVFGLESHMVSSVCSALSNKAANWGTFDKIVMKDVEDLLSNNLAELNAKLAAAEPATQQRAAAVEAATGGVAAAEAAEKAAEEADAAAKAASKEADATAKAAHKKVKQFQPQIDKAMKAIESAKADLDSFTSGAMAAYTELEAYTAPPPPPAPVEPEVAVEAEAAPAEAAPAAM